MNRDKLLSKIGYTEASTFNELCKALGDDIPTDKAEWRELFLAIEDCAKQGHVEIEKLNGKIDSIKLTEQGAALVREIADSNRPLFE